MSAFDEVVIDEVRFPRMFGSMRRAGMYRRCGCAGCPPCRNAAQRLLRGIARSPQASAPYRPDQWGNRYRTLSRRIGRRKVSVLADMDGAAPTVVDVAVDNDGTGALDVPTATSVSDAPNSDVAFDSSADDAAPDQELLGDMLIKKGPRLTSLVTRLNAITDGPGGQPLNFSGPYRADRLTALKMAPNVRGKGLYLIQWKAGHYFGKADMLLKRLAGHVQAIKRYGVDTSEYSIWFAATKSDPRVIEHTILTLVEASFPKFRNTGLTNLNREFEFELF